MFSGPGPNSLTTEAEVGFICPIYNMDAPNGELTAEVLAAHGQVLAASAPLSGDLPRAEFHWQQGSLEITPGARSDAPVQSTPWAILFLLVGNG